MKFTILTSILAACTVLAAPDGRCDRRNQPSTGEVKGAIQDWLQDVKTVNAFVDMRSPPTSAQASNALQFAKNEPNDLMVLSRICDVSDRYNRAVKNLNKVFGGVLSNLQSIVDNPSSAPQAVANINQIRCCNVLPDLDVLWREAAERYRIKGQVQTNVPRPQACRSVRC
ncbi:hypothetical protein PG993_015266 [Apiospora rasikravindrae]|uniref:Uncharacterized protein n=1 Tax=Apiospora rasikravindrae TaxID=990691 RepID=A0ABR1RQH2_9PEZI